MVSEVGWLRYACDQGEVYVIRNLKNNLLGLPAITGLGTFGEDYTIKLQEGAVPHALYTSRNVPIPLRKKVREELDRMESIGVITKVTEPTPWCAGLVAVPKKSGQVRICRCGLNHSTKVF